MSNTEELKWELWGSYRELKAAEMEQRRLDFLGWNSKIIRGSGRRPFALYIPEGYDTSEYRKHLGKAYFNVL